MTKSSQNTETELQTLREKLKKSEELTSHLREQLLATHARRVKLQGYLHRFTPFPNSFFSSPWEVRYFCLVDRCLKSFLSEEKVALIPEMELHVNGCSLQWEGLKRERFWTFSILDSAGCVLVRLSSTSESTAQQWMSVLTSSTSPKLTRMQSLPTQTTLSGTKTTPFEECIPLKKDSEKTGKSRTMVGSTPVHQDSKSSILSSERLFQHPHPGLLNLGVVILLAANFRLVLENLFKYGCRVKPLIWIQSFLWGSSQPLMLCWPVLGICCLICFLLEKLMVRQLDIHQKLEKKTDKKVESLSGTSLVHFCHFLNSLVCFSLPLWLVYISEEAILPSFVLTMVTVIVCMKLISYAHCNSDLRTARITQTSRPGERDSTHPLDDSNRLLKYPENLTSTNFLYFLFAPTLSYQLSYPRTKYIRRKWLIRRLSEFVIALALQVAIIDQYIVPTVQNTMLPMKTQNSMAFLERVLKLSLPVLYTWLIMFYLFFHLWLNILAEVLRFGDREFYSDWWNAVNLAEYWKMWNMPVHKWMLRTLYYPAINVGLSRSSAMLVVFFVSALVHEVLVMVPLKLTSTFPWSFVGMMMQVPLIFVSQFLQRNFGDRWGNIIFWVSFCFVGQPICLLYYYYDWIHANTTS